MHGIGRDAHKSIEVMAEAAKTNGAQDRSASKEKPTMNGCKK
jgi:hypothetical protein